jgi:hypothetical protein
MAYELRDVTLSIPIKKLKGKASVCLNQAALKRDDM